jgi:hypothetical protein
MTTAIIRLTPGVRRVKAAEVGSEGGFVAPVDEVVEVLGFRSMRVTLRVVDFEGVTGPTVLAMSMLTGMDLNEPGSFTSVGSFEYVTTAPAFIHRVCTDLQRYVRWRVIGLMGADAVSFVIEGVAYE